MYIHHNIKSIFRQYLSFFVKTYKIYLFLCHNFLYQHFMFCVRLYVLYILKGRVFMMLKTVNEGDFYKHFKGQIYQIRALATNSEDNTQMVVYQAMYPPFGIWVRPLSMFLEKLDKEKYPDASQEYRFEKISFDNVQTGTPQLQNTLQPETLPETTPVTASQNTDDIISVSDDEITDALLSGQVEKKLAGKISDKHLAAKGLMSFLDAENYHDKRVIFFNLRPYLNDTLLNNIAVTLDLVLDNGSLEQHFDTILNCLQTHEHYECSRLR